LASAAIPEAQSLRFALGALADGWNLTADQARAAVAALIEGSASEAEIAGFLTALRMKGETAEELAGAVEAVRERMTPLEVARRPVLDTCGTGGDGASTVNVSTAAALVAAAAGAVVAKHGNRSASGVSGSSDVLQQLGVPIEAETDRLARCLDEIGIAFLFAPRFHPALKHAAPVRSKLPFRTLFNLVGPLANPARPEFQVLGVPNRATAHLMATALQRLGTRRAAVFTGFGGLDEVSLEGPTEVLWIEDGAITPATWTPEDFELPPVSNGQLRVSSAEDSAARLREVFEGASGPIRSVIVANAAAALFVSGGAGTLAEAARAAETALDSGATLQLLERWRAILA